MKITYFVHSITTDNERGIATGWLNGTLSDEGIRRAKALHDTLKNLPVDAIYCSDLERAIQSAKLFFGNDSVLQIDSRLRECNYGDYDGLPVVTFKKDREQYYIDTPYPSGESYKDVEIRMKNFLDSLLQTDYSHVAIVAHQAPQLALDVLLKHLTWEQAIAADWRKTNAWQAGWEYSV